MINNKAKLYVDYIGDFEDINKAQEIADKQYNKGIKVIFHASGDAGKGVIKEAQSRCEKGEEVFVVGVDRDQYKDGFYGKQKKSVILTSALKRIDQATYQAAKMVLDNDFKPEFVVLSIKDNGVGYPEINPNLNIKIIAYLERTIKEMKNGTIKVANKPVIKVGSSN